MGLFNKKSRPVPPPPSVGQWASAATDDRYPGVAGYVSSGLKKNAMPELRFTFVRPDGKPEA